MNFNGQSYGGLLSFLAILAAVVFFAILMFGGTISNWPLEVVGLFCFALSFFLARLGL